MGKFNSSRKEFKSQQTAVYDLGEDNLIHLEKSSNHSINLTSIDKFENLIHLEKSSNHSDALDRSRSHYNLIHLEKSSNHSQF